MAFNCSLTTFNLLNHCSLQIEELLIEMSDDPFEVKLRDNYELLEDEYKESQKRRTMLDVKVKKESNKYSTPLFPC